ncbi:MAG: alpha/beta fold hydrolase [Proteobacteria bacterium]|nr:alpha/beta fold hydrolase [Pseudomonadota bacterium]
MRTTLLSSARARINLRDKNPQSEARMLPKPSRILMTATAGLLLACLLWFALPALVMGPAHAHVGDAPADLDAQNVAFASDPGIVIHGWFIQGNPRVGAVLLLHGIHANRLMEVGRARFLHQAGYAILAIDFRAHGESTGDRITFGYREADDVAASVAYLRKRAPGERIGVIGTSMGGAAFLLGTPPLRVDAAVLEQVYPSIDLALDHRMTRYLGPPGHALSPVVLNALGRRTGFSPSDLRPIDHLEQLQAPLFLIGGAMDRYTLPAESRAMFAAAGTPKRFWLVPGADHIDLQQFTPMEYRQRILAFFHATLESGSASARNDGLRARRP